MGPQEALLEQSRTLLEWLRDLTPEAFERPSVLPGWNLRQLAGHLVLVHTLARHSLDQPTKEPALPSHEYVKRYRRDIESLHSGSGRHQLLRGAKCRGVVRTLTETSR